jgi:hypothetical protein
MAVAPRGARQSEMPQKAVEKEPPERFELSTYALRKAHFSRPFSDSRQRTNPFVNGISAGTTR